MKNLAWILSAAILFGGTAAHALTTDERISALEKEIHKLKNVTVGAMRGTARRNAKTPCNAENSAELEYDTLLQVISEVQCEGKTYVIAAHAIPGGQTEISAFNLADLISNR